ncbi:MAG: glutathione peroxidase [Proteobacteria bacterium]|nr:MAG: glutathione peroxidase [Pseudomonadota bacterium]
MPQSVYDFKVKTIDGSEQSLKPYQGRVLLIVNVASKCGFTPQYKGLEELQKKFEGRGFSVLGFPCNQFGAQEPGDENEIKNFCELTYQVSFPMFSKVDVNGAAAAPLFAYLKEQKKGVLGTSGIKWNFTKFLVDAEGKVTARYAPNAKPESLAGAVEALLPA